LRIWCIAIIAASLALLLAAQGGDEPYAPHTPTLIFYLSGNLGPDDQTAISTQIAKLPSAVFVKMNSTRGYVRVRFDSHIVSYHQVAQAIADAGTSLHKRYDPYLVFIVPDYAKAGNAAKVDAIFAGRRLNQRVHVRPLDKSKGEFVIHFLPLQADAGVTGPQGFNGGHLHHPISDPPPRGLGLPSGYAADDDPSFPAPPGPPATHPSP